MAQRSMSRGQTEGPFASMEKQDSVAFCSPAKSLKNFQWFNTQKPELLARSSSPNIPWQNATNQKHAWLPQRSRTRSRGRRRPAHGPGLIPLRLHVLHQKPQLPLLAPAQAHLLRRPKETDFGFAGWMVWVGLGWVGLGWVGLGWVGLGWVGLGWVGLGWVGLGWLGWLVGLRLNTTFTREESS